MLLYLLESDWGAGLPIGIKTLCRLPTVTGDGATFNGELPWPVGDENAGVADLELLKDTEKKIKSLIANSHTFLGRILHKHLM